MILGVFDVEDEAAEPVLVLRAGASEVTVELFLDLHRQLLDLAARQHDVIRPACSVVKG